MSRPFLLALALCLAPSAALADEPVRVTNFPQLQEVHVRAFPEVQGVELRSHAPVTQDLAWRDRLVAPDPPSMDAEDLERMHELGSLDATGFARLAVSVAGRSGGSPLGTPELELVLLPDEPFVVEAWKTDGVVLLEERIALSLDRRTKGLVEARAAAVPLRFPRYLAFLSNSASGSLRLDLYLHLSE